MEDITSLPGFSATPEPPVSPAEGQLWQKKAEGTRSGPVYVFIGGEWKPVADAVDVISRMVFDMEPTERLRLLYRLNDRFCRHCGHDHPAGQTRCHCNNDE